MKRYLQYSEDKICGMLFGLFIGDSIGAIFEGEHSDTHHSLDMNFFALHSPLFYTDDTQMAISVFEEMLENGEVIQSSIRERFLKRFSPWRRYGGGMLEVIERWRNGEGIESAARKLYGGTGSFGDGAAMRVAPISGFYGLQEQAELFEQVTRGSVITHTHAFGISGALLQSYAVLLALNDVPLEEWMARFFELPIESAYKIKLMDVVQSLQRHATPQESASIIGNGADALDAVPAAIFAAMRNYSSFEDAVLFAVSMGGDTDTIGAMSGAIMGAHLGFKKIPSVYLENLENEKEGRNFIETLVGYAVKMREENRRGEDSNLR